MSNEYSNHDIALDFFITEIKSYKLQNNPHIKPDFKAFKESLLDQYQVKLHSVHYQATREKGDWLFRKAIEIINLKIGN